MKSYALSMAIILGLVPGIIALLTPGFAYAIPPEAEIEVQVLPESSLEKPAPDMDELSRRDVFEINFTVRLFLWALDRRQAEVLSKIASPMMRSDFPDAQTMMMAMTRVHAAVIGAKQVFLHLPDVNNGFAVQAVYLDDRIGNPWKATYMLRRDENGRYGIFGCIVKKLAGKFS